MSFALLKFSFSLFSFDSSAAREFPGLVGSANFEANFSVGFDFARFIIKSVGFDLKLLGRFCVFLPY